MDGNLEISLDKLPLKRLEAIEENGLERFPADVGYDEKRVSLIRRIDFAWAVEEQDDKQKKKKQKKSSKESSTPWQWQSMVENLQLAHQELSVILDLINTVSL
ncbi:mediator of RNA polymerase II transcription subunit 17-like [Carica papaya]|uniref:mediator of RNA polymerase II transcription subunit 17-like n=1 Tax=Carica papaya TaxID=3649 RepID=UPI000B8CCED3|nr:mediator of RNA polymerase II transcription subunit 17-like [Carica papaya]